ncbi:twin-arginine translocation signal domain-containing protein, partial [Streptomyces scabiei]
MSREHELAQPPDRRLLLKGALAAGALAALPPTAAHA